MGHCTKKEEAGALVTAGIGPAVRNSQPHVGALCDSTNERHLEHWSPQRQKAEWGGWLRLGCREWKGPVSQRQGCWVSVGGEMFWR